MIFYLFCKNNKTEDFVFAPMTYDSFSQWREKLCSLSEPLIPEPEVFP